MTILSIFLTGAFILGVGLVLFQIGSSKGREKVTSHEEVEPVVVEEPTIVVENKPVALEAVVTPKPKSKRNYKKKPKAATQTKETK